MGEIFSRVSSFRSVLLLRLVIGGCRHLRSFPVQPSFSEVSWNVRSRYYYYYCMWEAPPNQTEWWNKKAEDVVLSSLSGLELFLWVKFFCSLSLCCLKGSFSLRHSVFILREQSLSCCWHTTASVFVCSGGSFFFPLVLFAFTCYCHSYNLHCTAGFLLEAAGWDTTRLSALL